MEQQPVWLALCSVDHTLMQATAACLQECDPMIHSVIFRRGAALLAEISQAPERYQYILMDDMLRDMDVLEFMLQLQALGLKAVPCVLYVTTPTAFSRVLHLLPGDGRNLVFLPGPLRPTILASRLRTFCSVDACRKKSDGVQQLLQTLHLTGKDAQYLRSALLLRLKSGEELALRKGLLQATADQYGVSLAAVDSALRRGIKNLEEENTAEYQRFKKQYGLGDKRPTVASFLDACTCCLRKRTE